MEDTCAICQTKALQALRRGDWRDYRLLLAEQPLDAAATKIQALAVARGQVI